MDDADGAGAGVDLDCERHTIDQVQQFALSGGAKCFKPLLGEDPEVPICVGGNRRRGTEAHNSCGKVVVAKHRMKPGLVQKPQRFQAVRATINQISDANDAIAAGSNRSRSSSCSSNGRIPCRSATTKSRPPRFRSRSALRST